MKRKKAIFEPWTPFYRCNVWKDGTGVEQPIPDSSIVLRNNVYTVMMSGCDVPPPMGPMTWLSIKRNDRRTIHDWRDLQRIKNLTVGDEIEAVEVYPAESRLNDTANQYHMWCFAPGFQLPFGYANRFVADETTAPNSPAGNKRQRRFPHDNKPNDCLRGADLSGDLQARSKLVHTRLISPPHLKRYL